LGGRSAAARARPNAAQHAIARLQRLVGNQATAALMRRAAGERDDEASTAPGAQAPPIVYDVLRGQGRPLTPTIRAAMERQVGTSLEDVRVHSDPRAQQSAADVGALAYTVGRDIVFGSPGFDPSDPSHLATLGHEATHVVQQGVTPWRGEQLQLDSPDTPEERAAEDAGAAVGSASQGERASEEEREG
jgi:hypothetical protein